MSPTDPRGQFIWYELLTNQPESAISFYTKLIGWGVQQFEGGDTPYTMFTTDDFPMAGVMQLPEEAVASGAPPHWLPYIGTDDVDATAEKTTSLGGQILVAPQDIPSVGRFAVLRDPQGAVFATYTPSGEHPGRGEAPKVGQFSWHELATTDHEAAFDFYNTLFDWDKTDAMDMGEAGIYQMYGRAGQTLGGMFNKPPQMPGPPYWLCYVRVDDLKDRVQKVKQMGGQVLNGPMEVPGGDLIAQCMDPQGGAFALHSSTQG